MNSNVKKLNAIAAKKSRVIIGLMSGTSLDGLDVALCRISSSGVNTKVKLLDFETIAYTQSIKNNIRKVFAKRSVDFAFLCELNASIGALHADMILKCLKQWKYKTTAVDLIASHGQTVFHAPKQLTRDATINSTLQIGDGDHIAVKTGIITLSDFRQKHIAAGGEGAPLAVYGDYQLFSKKGEDRIMINIGGIGNFTFLPADCDPKKVFVTDTGPGNTLIDQAMQHYGKGAYDKNAKLAKTGNIDYHLLKAMMAHPFFSQSQPKTTGPELFNLEFVRNCQHQSDTLELGVQDLITTLTRFSAETISAEIKKAIGNKKFNGYLSGGGAHNPLLTFWLKELLPNGKFKSLDALGISGDAKEAILFAVLANETVAGGKLNFGNRYKVPGVTMGKISFPN